MTNVRSFKLIIALLVALLFATHQQPTAVFAIETECCTQATHIVVAGDTLTRIANTYGTTVEVLLEANNLSDSLIRIGQTLVIPGDITSTLPTATSDPSFYLVFPGDSLAKLAVQFDTDVETLMSINQLTTDVLQIGQLLQLPELPPSPQIYSPFPDMSAQELFVAVPSGFVNTPDELYFYPGQVIEFGLEIDASFAYATPDKDQIIDGFITHMTLDDVQSVVPLLLSNLQAHEGDAIEMVSVNIPLSDEAWRAQYVSTDGLDAGGNIMAYDVLVFEKDDQVVLLMESSMFVTPTVPFDLEAFANEIAQLLANS